MSMSLGSVMNSALKAMAANQLALSVASNNIANAQNPEFTRQRLVTAPSGSGGDLLGIGTGVEVLGIRAVRDGLIEKRLRQEISARSGDDMLTRRLSQVEGLFNDTEDTGLLLKITNFFNSFHTLSLDPASINFREEIKTNARELAGAFQTRSRELMVIQNDANETISDGLEEVHLLAAQIASLSAEIKFQGVSNDANDLRDRRATLVKQLSEIVEVYELESNGDYRLSTKDNQLLVLNGDVHELKASGISAGIGNGSLKAAVEMRDQYIPKYLNALDQLAYELADRVNSIHSGAYGLDGTTGVGFFAPLSAVSGAARRLDVSQEVSGDVRKIAASARSTGNDNEAALEIGNLLHAAVFSGGSVTDQYRSIVFDIGSNVATAQSNYREHDALVTQLHNRRQSVSGVSIDEETVQMLQFQRSYEASARLIRTVDELLQVALGLGT